MRKSIILGASLILLASCGGTPSTSAPTTSENPTNTSERTEGVLPPATISLWVKSDANSDLYKDMALKFKEEYPQFTVNVEALEDIGNYNDIEAKVLSGFTSGTYPNMVQAYPGHAADYMVNNKVLNMDKYINHEKYGWTEEEKGLFDLSAGQNFAKEGTYVLPFNKSTEVLYYNRDKLVGLDLSKIDSSINEGRPLTDKYLQHLTWEELFEKLSPALITYNEQNPGLINTSDEYWSVLHYEDDQNQFITRLQQYGIPYTSIGENEKPSVDFVNDEAKALMKKIAGYAEKRYIISRWSSEGSSGYSSSHVLNESALFAVNSTVGAPYFYDSRNPIDIGIGTIPQAAGKKEATILQGTSLAFLDKGDENQNIASWLFYKFMTNYENSLNYSLQSGYLPNRIDVYEDPDYISHNNPDQFSSNCAEKVKARVATYVEELENHYFTEAPFPGSSAVRNAISYLNSNILAEGRKGTVTDEYINEKFTEAYNTALSNFPA